MVKFECVVGDESALFSFFQSLGESGHSTGRLAFLLPLGLDRLPLPRLLGDLVPPALPLGTFLGKSLLIKTGVAGSGAGGGGGGERLGTGGFRLAILSCSAR